MARALGDLLTTLSWFVPLRVLIPLVAVLFLLSIPAWLESVRDRQIRGLVRRLVRAGPEERAPLERRLARLTAGRASRLRALVEAASRYDQRALRERALTELEAAGAAEDARRFREAEAPPRSRFRDATEAALRVETLLDEGRTVAAAELLADARRSFPGDAELRELERRIPADPPPAT